MTNPYVLQEDRVFKLHKKLLLDAQFVISMLTSFYSEKFTAGLRNLPPAYVSDATDSENRANFVVKLLYDTLSLRRDSVKRHVLEWALQSNRNACDAMATFLKLQSKLLVGDETFAKSMICVEQRVFTIEGQVLVKQRDNMKNTLERLLKKMQETYAYEAYFFGIADNPVSYLRQGNESVCNELHHSSRVLLEQNEREWRILTSQVDLLDIIGSYYMGRIAQIYDEIQSTGGESSPLLIAYGNKRNDLHYLDASDACRCLPVEEYTETSECYRFYARAPSVRVRITKQDHARVRIETQRAQAVLAEAFLTQKASNENTLGYQNKSKHAAAAVQRARRQALLSFMARSKGVYACRFVLMHDLVKRPRWCIGVE